MLVCPHEILQNQSLSIEGVKVQNNSWRRSRRLLRVAASSNTAVNRGAQTAGFAACLGARYLRRWAT
ncbi:hypothetical protein A6P08_00535 [Acidithiobacillus thiooxidans]|nr:hypothetical protein A6P08_00535 [Acidithiobacillus thiooxidans]